MERLSKLRSQIAPSLNAAKSDPALLIRLTPACWELTLNQPEILNGFTQPMIQRMDTFLLALSTPPTKVLIFRGAGETSFSVGGNLKKVFDFKTVE